jgi:hypothetical protein
MGNAPEHETQAPESSTENTQEPEQSEQQSNTEATTPNPEQEPDTGCKSIATASAVLLALTACAFVCKKKKR